MQYVVIERPRVHGDGGRSIPRKGYKKRQQKTPLDESPKRENIKALCGGTKDLTDVLGPLEGYLYKHCGRPWNKVFSEICENLRQDSPIQSHIRDHLKHFVHTNIIIVDGKVRDSDGMSCYSQFYVDPRNGLLKKNSNYGQRFAQWRRQKEKKNYIRGKDKSHQYHLLDGVWYELELAPIPLIPYIPPTALKYRLVLDPSRKDPSMHGVLDVTHSVCEQPTVADCRRRYGSTVYCAKKRQLPKKEIRKLKLWETEIGREYLETR